MKELKTSLSVDKMKQTQFGGGNVCVSACGRYLLCVLGSSVNVIDVSTGCVISTLESEEEDVTCMALSPDNRHLVSAHRNLLLKQWDNWRGGDESKEEAKYKKSAAMQPDSDERNSTNSSTSTCTRTWKAIHTAPVVFMRFDATSTLLATSGSDYTVKIWDLGAQYCTHNLKGSQGIVRAFQFHPRLEQVAQCAAGCDDGKLRLFNMRTSRVDAALEGHFSAITCVEYLQSSSSSSASKDAAVVYDRLLSSARDKVLIVWDLATHAKLRTLPIYESIESFLLVSRLFSSSSSLAATANDANDSERYLISMGNEGVLKLWDLKTARVIHKQSERDSLRVLNKRKNKSTAELELVITQAVFNEATSTLVLVTTDQLIVFVHVDVDRVRAIIDEQQESPSASESLSPFAVSRQYIGDHGEIFDAQYCSSDEHLLAFATNSEYLKVYDLRTWDCQLLKGHTDLIICLSVFWDKRSGADQSVSYLASSSKDTTIRVWRISHASTVSEAEASEIDDDGKNNNAASNRTPLRYSFQCVAIGMGHTQDVGSLCFARLGFDFLVSGSIDTTLKVWKLPTLEALAAHASTSSGNGDALVEPLKLSAAFTVKAHEKDINCVCVSPNDKLVASCSTDKTAKIWSAADGSCVGILRGHKRGIWCIQFSPVDQVLVTSSADATIKLWSLTDCSCVKTFEGHNTSVLKVLFINHGSQLISSASDGLIKLWSIKSNECVGTFDHHDNKAWALCMSADEAHVVSGGADGKLILWSDVTQAERSQELEKREEILLQEQELSNLLKEKKWKRALGLAIRLDKPYRCYEIVSQILTDSSDSSNGRTKGQIDLENTLLKLKDFQIRSLIKYSTEWNSNTKFCHVAQCIFEIVLRSYPPEFFVDSRSEVSFEETSRLCENFLPYSERHCARLNKLAQQIMFIDFAWRNMKLDDSDSKTSTVDKAIHLNQIK